MSDSEGYIALGEAEVEAADAAETVAAASGSEEEFVLVSPDAE